MKSDIVEENVAFGEDVNERTWWVRLDCLYHGCDRSPSLCHLPARSSGRRKESQLYLTPDA